MAVAEMLNHWKFYQHTNGIVQDLKGNLPATVDRFVAVTGKSGAALKFSKQDGAQVVTLGGTDVPPPWTFGVWVRREKDTPGCTFLSSTKYAIKLEQWPHRNVLGITKFGVKDWTISVGLPLNVWTYLTIVAQPNETKFYLDGQEVGTVATSIDLPRGFIGSTCGYTEFLEASIEELQLHQGIVEPATLYQPPQLSVSHGGQPVAANGNIDLGSTPINTTVVRTVVISNSGKGILDIASIQLDDGSGQLSMAPSAGTLEADKSLELTVTMKASAAGAVMGKLTLTSNDPAHQSSVISLSGNVEEAPKKPVFNLSVNSQNPPHNDTITATTFYERGGAQYPTITVGQQLLAASLLASNTGNAPLSVQQVYVEGGEFCFAPECGLPTTIQPGASRSLGAVSFRPNSPGTKTARVTVVTRDPANPNRTFYVQATAQDVPDKASLVLKQYFSYTNIYEVAINNGDVTTFGEHRSYDQFSSLAYYIENSGNGPLRVDGVSISNPSMFIPTTDVGTPDGARARFPVEVPPGGRYILFLVYYPQGLPRPHSTTVSLRTSDTQRALTTWTVNIA